MDAPRTRISIIVALAKNNVIGSTKTNDLLWRIPEDLKHFKNLTSGHATIMGRKTYDSIGKPLPNRLNIVISREGKQSNADNLIFTNSLDEALEKAGKFENDRQDNLVKEVFIIGGGQIYCRAFPLADKLYLTLVDASFDGNVFFPDYSEFKKIVSSESHRNDQYEWQFVELEK